MTDDDEDRLASRWPWSAPPPKDDVGAFHGLVWAAGLCLAGYAIIWLFYHFVLN